MKYSSELSVPRYSAMLSVCCLGLVSYTISLTLGVKVFFSCCCPTSFALLHFSISLSVALPLSVFLSHLIICLPFSALFPSFTLLLLLSCPWHQKLKNTNLPLRLLLLKYVFMVILSHAGDCQRQLDFIG